MSKPTKFSFATILRSLPTGGAFSSAIWGDTLEEIVKDLAKITSQWNLAIVPLLTTVPDGTRDTNVDAFKFGLDARHLWVHSSASTSTSRYYNSSRKRPNTVYEQIEGLYSELASLEQELESTTSNISGGLTQTQKEAIGINVFDSTKTSSATSIDGRSKNNRYNITQLAKDIYGAGYALDNDGNANLVNSLQAMVGALLTLHNGTWDTDIDISHDAPSSIPQTNVEPSAAEDDNDPFTGASADLEQDLNRLRTKVKDIQGTGNWTDNVIADYVGGPNDLQNVINEGGSALKTATNPWGYDYTDVQGLEARLIALSDYAGQADPLDADPAYTSIVYINQGDPLTAAISDLDLSLDGLAGDLVTLQTEVDDVGTYVGQAAPGDTTPSYTSTNFVTQGTPLTVAISDLDAEILNIDLLGSAAVLVHMKGAVGTSPLPSGEHWDEDITSVDYSGANYRDVLDFIIDPTHGPLDNQNLAPDVNTVLFRRREDWIPSGTQQMSVAHGRGVYPIVQAFFWDPPDGMAYSLYHDSPGKFVFSGYSVVNSGMIISLW